MPGQPNRISSLLPLLTIHIGDHQNVGPRSPHFSQMSSRCLGFNWYLNGAYFIQVLIGLLTGWINKFLITENYIALPYYFFLTCSIICLLV